MNMASPITQRTLTRFAPAEDSLRRTISDWGIRGVSAIGAAACRMVGPRVAGQFGILLYHRIANDITGIEKPSINVPPRQFERQIRGLAEAGFVFWSLRRVLEHVARGERIPPYVIVLTFDDGFEGVYRNAWPILRELKIPATVFLATAYLGSKQPFPFDHWGQSHSNSVPPSVYRPMTIEQCQELAASRLIEFGAHTHTHEDFRNRPDAFREDLQTNVTALKEMLPVTEVAFAFPYGTPRLGFAEEALTLAAREVGVSCALTTRSSLVQPDESPFEWGRFTVFPWDTGATLAAKLGGWYGWAPAIKDRLLGRPKPALTRTKRMPGVPIAAEAMVAPSQQRPTISVVVPTFNRADWLADALRSLVRQRTDDKFEMEIVVCDNASTDDTAAVVATAAESSAIPIRYCFQSQPGDAPTRNFALQQSSGDWLAFFDDDQLAPENWLSELFVAAERTGGSIVGGAVQLDLTAAQRTEFGSYLREALRETNLYTQLQPYLRRELPGTGNALVARSVFDAIGTFSESFINGGSDYDFFARARTAGFAMWYTPDAVIRHRVAPSRLSAEHLRLDALSGGAEHAGEVDLEEHGLSGVLGRGAARVGQALLIHGPLMLSAWLRNDRGGILGRRIRLWRTEGYLRRCIDLVAPKLFPQQRFFGSLSYRHGRPNIKALTKNVTS
ncbi:MAG: glycosyltransferase [Planctomycetes bacterium]|nr:glycosyltransferase [Planctomycetota bacterium]